MPIHPDNQRLYPDDWDAISYRIRFDRAGGRCECRGECGLHRGRRCEERHGTNAAWAHGRVVLTVTHLDHDPTNCEDSNLRAMCNRCHLRYDTEHHKASRAIRADKECGQMRFEDVTNA